MITKADIHQSKMDYFSARAEVISARTQMKRSIRERVTSPPMLLTWFTLGWRAGRDMMRNDENKPKSTFSKIRPFVTMLLMRMF